MKLVHAEAKSIDACLVQLGAKGGLTEPGSSTQLAGFIEFGIDNPVLRSPLWGFFDPATAGESGYNNPASADWSPTITIQHGVTRQQFATCQKRTSDEYDGGGQFAFSMIDLKELPSGGPVTPLSDPRVRAVNAKWSACMQRSGYRYANPIDAYEDPQWTRAGVSQQEEVKVAKADIACKRSTNLVGIDLAVQDAYDQVYISKHRKALKKRISQIRSFADGQ